MRPTRSRREVSERVVPGAKASVPAATGSTWICNTDDQTTEVARLAALGARLYPWRYRVGADFVVLEDPDANLFCVVQQREHWSQAATEQ